VQEVPWPGLLAIKQAWHMVLPQRQVWAWMLLPLLLQ
jgi:hypothetical protein